MWKEEEVREGRRA